MSRSSYHQIATLATHPAFSRGIAALRCPLCPSFTTTRCGDYDRHFLAHDPTPAQAEQWLSGRQFEKEALRRRWASPCAGSGTRPQAPAPDPLSALSPALRSRRGACPECQRPLSVARGRVPVHLPQSR